jgi:hypothetical protein
MVKTKNALTQAISMDGVTVDKANASMAKIIPAIIFFSGSSDIKNLVNV